MTERVRTVILGAAGRDFHNFNVYFRDRPEYEVVAFTATQIPGIEGRTYPPSLSGSLYPSGIPILPETNLPEIITRIATDTVGGYVHVYNHTEAIPNERRVRRGLTGSTTETIIVLRNDWPPARSSA